ncbi:MAG TPA: RNA polymerase sigma factor [Bacteroidota bacterium]|nr:RNA polymerase sigma factor [Bacteroidota bacterium]
MQQKTDQELLALMRGGSQKAFAELYRRYRSGLYAFCFRLLGNRDEAEDAVHETFARLAASGASIAEPRALKAWLYRVARNEGLMGRRHNGATGDADSVWAEDTPQSIAERADTRSLVREAMERLRVEYREVLLLREFEGMTYDEITEVTGASPASVKSRLFRARRALAGLLENVRNEERNMQ